MATSECNMYTMNRLSILGLAEPGHGVFAAGERHRTAPKPDYRPRMAWSARPERMWSALEPLLPPRPDAAHWIHAVRTLIAVLGALVLQWHEPSRARLLGVTT